MPPSCQLFFGDSDHALPFQRQIESPTAQTSLGPLPQIVRRAHFVLLLFGSGDNDHAVPSQCVKRLSIVPRSDHTSLGPLPQMAMPLHALVESDHTLPSQCKIARSPAAQ